MGVMSAIGLVYALVKQGKERQRIAALPPVATIASARPGLVVRIVGTIVEGGTVNGPITGRVCVCFNAVIHPVGAGQGDRRSWGQPLNRVGGAPFVVDDGTGRIDVDPGGLVIRAEIDHHRVERAGATIHDATMIPDWVRYDELVLDEGVLQLRDRVVLEGVVERASLGPDVSVFRAGVPPRATLASAGDRPATISNLPANVEEATRALRLALRTK